MRLSVRLLGPSEACTFYLTVVLGCCVLYGFRYVMQLLRRNKMLQPGLTS